ncbi:MAG: hypothetical protein CMO97_04065 [Woeseia sp.]|nr:hypothetical protein [Woeseia sp.]|tara:strand:- start:1474 stop:1719 length:246 start_codon:yes stop_codon:yes gene_type:complete
MITINDMPRISEKGYNPIRAYEVNHGYDQDCHKWFIDLTIEKHGSGNILKWYDTEIEYKNDISKFLRKASNEILRIDSTGN